MPTRRLSAVGPDRGLKPVLKDVDALAALVLKRLLRADLVQYKSMRFSPDPLRRADVIR